MGSEDTCILVSRACLTRNASSYFNFERFNDESNLIAREDYIPRDIYMLDVVSNQFSLGPSLN